MEQLTRYWNHKANPLLMRQCTWMRAVFLYAGMACLSLGVLMAAYVLCDLLTAAYITHQPALVASSLWFWLLMAMILFLGMVGTLTCILDCRRDWFCCYVHSDVLRQYAAHPPKDTHEWFEFVYTKPLLARHVAMACDDDGATWSHVPTKAEFASLAMDSTCVPGESAQDHFVRICQHVQPSRDTVQVDSSAVSTSSTDYASLTLTEYHTPEASSMSETPPLPVFDV